MSDDPDDDMESGFPAAKERMADDVHPYFEDDVAQRVYAATILVQQADKLACPDLKKASLDFLAAVMRSISLAEKPVSRLK